MFKWLSSDRPAPEELELEAKLQQLEVLEERYAEVQTEYATLQNGLAAFKLRYWRRVGDLYARLDRVRAEIAQLRVRLAPRDALRQAAARAASTQAQASAEAARAIDIDPGAEEFMPSDDLRKYYRMAAKIVHPDRAGDDDDRSLRDEIMSRINVAYRDGHVHTIQALIDEYQMRAQPGEDDAATRLIRTIRLMSRVREQISNIGQTTATLRESGLYRLYKAVEEAEARGEDKLRIIEIGIERDIARAENELARLRQQALMPVAAEVAAAGEPSPEGEPGDSQDEPAEDEAAMRQPQFSPAELAIAALLDELGLEYAYRQPLAGSARPGEREPAFTIRDAKGQSLLWEHLGVLESEALRTAWQERQGWFAANGFDAGINLFVTRDEADGTFDAARLRKMAEFIRSQCE
ncbi:J domain-containing protein [Uliginosibacterium aquaticum]|uniref:J domain-containing protein n=1 Tax=Uliginosibacterium aquaticum TaxID=2731212 RepID=A0ABX2IJR9_9RHOO|nr:J domain-containing protein [Uliginosibacterium aquaticum]NSL57044.1 J domain-containing protein [Uliginosibacterium aquaticum]